MSDYELVEKMVREMFGVEVKIVDHKVGRLSDDGTGFIMFFQQNVRHPHVIIAYGIGKDGEHYTSVYLMNHYPGESELFHKVNDLLKKRGGD